MVIRVCSHNILCLVRARTCFTPCFLEDGKGRIREERENGMLFFDLKEEEGGGRRSERENEFNTFFHLGNGGR